jgi:hypothetical protein
MAPTKLLRAHTTQNTRTWTRPASMAVPSARAVFVAPRCQEGKGQTCARARAPTKRGKYWRAERELCACVCRTKGVEARGEQKLFIFFFSFGVRIDLSPGCSANASTTRRPRLVPLFAGDHQPRRANCGRGHVRAEKGKKLDTYRFFFNRPNSQLILHFYTFPPGRGAATPPHTPTAHTHTRTRPSSE